MDAKPDSFLTGSTASAQLAHSYSKLGTTWVKLWPIQQTWQAFQTMFCTTFLLWSCLLQADCGAEGDRFGAHAAVLELSTWPWLGSNQNWKFRNQQRPAEYILWRRSYFRKKCLCCVLDSFVNMTQAEVISEAGILRKCLHRIRLWTSL